MYTATEICNLARTIAKVPGYTAFSGQCLNLALRDLCLHFDLKQNRVVATIIASTGSNGPFALEADYLRTYDLFYQVNGMPFFLHPISPSDYDREFKDPSVANYPYEFMTLLANQSTQTPGQLFIYPQSTTQLSLTHRYMIYHADIASPESSSTVPWFMDQDYLVHATACRLMKISDDAREPKFRADAMEMLRAHLIVGDGDEQQVVHQVKLDPRQFNRNRSLKLTKNQPL